MIVAKYNSHCILNSVRILDENGKGGIEKIEPALEWCYQNNIKIVNLSIGTTNFNDCEKLKKLVNKYVHNGMIIVAATANSGFVSYPACFTNVIGVATIGSPLSYSKDYMQMGIDTVVPSEHMVKIFDEEIRTSLSNSYAAPYICTLIANRLNTNKSLGIKKLNFGLEGTKGDRVGKSQVGYLYDANYDSAVIDRRTKCADLCYEFNLCRPSDINKQQIILHELLGQIKGNIIITAPFYYDYGMNISVPKY